MGRKAATTAAAECSELSGDLYLTSRTAPIRSQPSENDPYLVAQRALSDVFAGKFLHGIKKAKLHANVRLPKRRWVVDVLAVGSGQAALRYLAPYIFRVAISNRRILKLQGEKVTFLFKDSKTKQEHPVVLTVNQFIHCFLQHVLPHRFIKVRTYGLFSPRHNHLLEKANKSWGWPNWKQRRIPPLRLIRALLPVRIVKTRCNISENLAESMDFLKQDHHDYHWPLFV
ncbi:transposase [bacterium]|nr:transposase [bacterium]MCI0606101.1 transposase [bacterium]